MEINDFHKLDISKNGKWGIGMNDIQHEPNDIYDSKIKQIKYHLFNIQDKAPLEEIYSFSYEEDYNNFADVQEYIGIRKYEWKEDSKLYLESVEGESDVIDLDNDSKEDIVNRINLLVREIKIY